ncbi:MAG: InlB B-repeat-containing protein, partial [Clostridiales bacterium]|nr:InlB B-repeat-containing protein [Clostridiales bacterium]
MKKRLSTTLTATMLVFLCAIFACVVAATWIIAAQPTSYQPEQKNYTVNYNFEYNAGKAGKAGNAHFDGLSDDADDRTTFLSEYKQEEAGKTISLTYNETPNPSSDGVHISDLLGFNFAGWDFTGWSYNDDKLTDVPTLFEGGTISLTIPKDSDLNLTYKLTAKWDAINYTVTFTSTEHSDLIKNLPASKTLTYEDGNDKFDLPGKDDIDDLSYLGYEFAGWKLTIGELSQNYRIDDTDSPYVFELAEDILIALDGKEEITLDAIWDKISYTVNYKDGTDEHPLVSQDDVIDGMPDPDTQEEYTVGQEVILPTLSRAGFDFLGWKLEDYTKYGSDYKEIYDPNSGDKFKMPAGDVTFTAQWKAIDYTVKFDNNGLGKKLEDKNITIEKDNNSVALEKLEEDGYTFMSWQLVEAEMDYIPDVNFTFVLDTTLIKYADKNNTFTLVAIWWTNRYTVSFVQGYDDTDKVDEWDEVTDLPTIDDIPDYEDGGYKAAGGYKIGDIVKLPRLEPTRIGFVFQGWKIDGDDTLYKHDAGDINNRSYTCGSSNIIFVAQWKAVEYTVKYDLDDGTFGNAIVPEITYKMGDSVTLTDEEPTKTGYTFTGWSLDDEKAVEEPITIRAIRTYAKGDDYSKTITFKALWDINTYKVTYDTNGGEGTYAIQGYDYGATVTVSENVPTRKGYTFKGWQATKTEGGEEINNKLYKPNDEFEMPAFDVTLLAQWDFITYKVEYNPTSGTIGEQGPSSLTIEDSSFTLPTITRDGYEFLGWKLSKTGLEDKYFGSGEQTTDLSDIIDYAVEKDGKWTITFTAEWSAKEFKVSYADSISGIEGDDVAGIPDGTTSHKTDSTFNLAVEPTRTGFTFNGWLCDADNKVYGAGEEFKMPARNVTFTAQWKAIKYTLTFDNTYNNKKLGQKQTDVYPLALNDTKTATLSILEEDGYTFDGWQLKGKDGETRDYLVKDGQIQSFELTIDIINGFVGADDTFTLYAIWKPIGYTVTFEDGITKVEDDDVVKEGTLPKNADITDYKDEYNIGDTITIPTKEPERIGFTFLGWKVKDGGDTIYKNGGANNTYTFSAGSVTFVAQWKAKPYDIKFVTAHNAENKPADAKLALAGDDYNKTITFYALTAAGYSFNGWEANVGQVETTTNVYTYTLTVATIKELEAATPTKAIVVTAQWGAKTYTVKFENGTADTGKSVTAKNLPDTKTLSFKEGGMTTFTVDTPIADGYTFAIWTSDIAGITFNGTFDLNTTGYTDLLDAHNGTVTFTATWTINEYDITYNLSAADASIVEQTYVQKFTIEDTNITWPTAQRTGYNFDGWYYDQSFAKKVGYTSKPIGEELYEALNGSTTVTLYAHWTNKTYAVEYAVDPAGAGELTGGATTISLDANSNKVTFGVTVGTGYNFNTPTWKVTIKGTDTVLGNVIASEANGKYSFTLTADLIKDHTIADNATIVITAEFAKNDYYIAYDKGEAKDDNTVANWPENDTTAYNIGKLVTVTDKIPTRDGYTFAGWEANITVSGVDLTKDFTLIAAIITALEEKNTDTITLKATWTKDSYNIKYDLDGEIKGLTTPYDIDTASVTLKTAEELAALGKTAPTGYRFDGWYLSN